MFKTLQWEDWAGIAVGLWMLASPWVLGYTDHNAATMNALLLGTVLIVVELLNLDQHQSAEEWIDIAAGLWLLASPFVVGFTSTSTATLNALAVGALTILLAVLALSPLDEKIRLWWREH
jgi:hypothetical protein